MKTIIIIQFVIICVLLVLYLLKRKRKSNSKPMLNSLFFWIKIENKWRHIYATRSGIVYLDGNEQSTDDVPAFGHWVRELTDNEISALYNGGQGISYTDFNPNKNNLRDGLVEFWEMDEQDGKTID